MDILLKVNSNGTQNEGETSPVTTPKNIIQSEDFPSLYTFGKYIFSIQYILFYTIYSIYKVSRSHLFIRYEFVCISIYKFYYIYRKK